MFCNTCPKIGVSGTSRRLINLFDWGSCECSGMTLSTTGKCALAKCFNPKASSATYNKYALILHMCFENAWSCYVSVAAIASATA